MTEAASTGFPSRSYVLTLPHGMKLKPGTVRLFENGQQVSDLSVTAVGESKRKQFGVVLAIDASISMRGRAIEGAMAAAQALSIQRQKNQLLGVITFNSTVTETLPLTTDPKAIETALSRTPALAPGTHIYDAVDSAVKILKERHVEAGSVVVLSDGADVGSTTPESVAAALTFEQELSEAFKRIQSAPNTYRSDERGWQFRRGRPREGAHPKRLNALPLD